MKTAFSRTALLCSLASLALLAGCANLRAPGEASAAPADTLAVRLADAERSRAPGPLARQILAATAEAPPEAAPRPEPRIYKGSDKVVNLPAGSVKAAQGEPVALRFERAPVSDVVHAILGDMLKQNYTIHPPVAGEVTLHTLAPLPPEQILTVLESMLQANGLAMAQDAVGIYHVGRPEALKGIVRVPHRVGRLPAGDSLLVVPLQFVGAAEMAEILLPVASPAAFVRVDNLRNLLILAGSRSQLDGWMSIVDMFDVDLLKGMSVGLFPLQNTSAKEVDAAFKLMSSGAASAAARAEGGVGGATGSASSPLGGALRIMPIERLNAILVVTPRAAYLEAAREWIERFDRPDNDAGPRLYVYPVQNGSANHLAVLLNGIFGGGALDSAATRSRDSGVAPGLASTSMGSGLAGYAAGQGGSSAGTSGQAASAAARAATGSSAATAPAQVSQLSLGDVRVVADDQNNALLIYAPRSAYAKIEAALRQMDVAAAQVLIEASIIEVSLTDETRYGLQWFFTDNLKGRGWTGSGSLGTGSGGAINAAQAGFSYTITNPLGQIRAVLNALADKQLLKVISSPSLMVLDNQTAEIMVGDQQPIRSATTVSDGGTTTESITYKDTGVILKVTPSVNAGNMITMEVDQSVTDVGPVDDQATGQRSFLQRQISSKIAVPSGETVVLGGLIRENNSRGKQGVPVLHDLPIIGALFGTTTLTSDRTELLVMITPRVVRTERDMRDVTDELQDRMYSLKQFLIERQDRPAFGQ